MKTNELSCKGINKTRRRASHLYIFYNNDNNNLLHLI